MTLEDDGQYTSQVDADLHDFAVSAEHYVNTLGGFQAEQVSTGLQSPDTTLPWSYITKFSHSAFGTDTTGNAFTTNNDFEFIAVDNGNLTQFTFGQFMVDSYSIAAVPEPVTWSLMLTGVGLVGGLVRRFWKTQLIQAVA